MDCTLRRPTDDKFAPKEAWPRSRASISWIGHAVDHENGHQNVRTIAPNKKLKLTIDLSCVVYFRIIWRSKYLDLEIQVRGYSTQDH